MNFGLGFGLGYRSRSGLSTSLADGILAQYGGFGLVIAAEDDSMSIKDAGVPANNYKGPATAKLGNVRTVNAMCWNAQGLLEFGPQNLLRYSLFQGGGGLPTGWVQGGILGTTGTSVPMAPAIDLQDGAVAYEQSASASPDRAYFVYTGGVTHAVGDNMSIAVDIESVSAGGIGASGIIAAQGTAVSTNVVYWFNGVPLVGNVMGPGLLERRFTIATVGTLQPRIGLGCDAYRPGTLRFSRPRIVQGVAYGKPYMPTTAAAVFGIRRDYNAFLSSKPKFLVELPATNLLKNSLWVGGGVGVPPTSWTNTMGAIEPSSLGTEDGAIAIRWTTVAQRFTIAQGSLPVAIGKYTASVYIEDNPDSQGANQIIGMANQPVGSSQVWRFNGVAVANPNSTPGNGETGRLECIMNFTTAGTVSVIIGSGVAGNANASMRLSRPQFEAGEYATSFIPTPPAATFTRTADIARIASTLFPFNSTEGTLFVSGRQGMEVITFARWAEISGGASLRVIDLSNASPTMFAAYASGGWTNNAVGPTSQFASFKLAARYKVDDYAVSANGAAPVTSNTVPTIPAPTNLHIGTNNGSTTQPNGWVDQIIYLPIGKSNAELQTMSA